MSNYKIYHNLPDDDKPKKPAKTENSDKTGGLKSGGRKPKKLTPAQTLKHVFSVIGTTFLTLFLITIITVCVVAVALSVYITQFAESMYDVDLNEVELSYNSFIFMRTSEGKFVDEYENEICPECDRECIHDDDFCLRCSRECKHVIQLSADENRIWVDLDDIPQHVLDALVATEDRRFYEHAGVDWTRTVFATMNEFFGGDERQQGGSTITQQLVRDITKDNQVNIGRKLREIFRAISFEQKYSKLDILESYLNRVAFGNTVYGIGSAARFYFGKTASELTIAEACILVGLLPSPVAWNPYYNPEQARRWQSNAIANMYDHGFISFAQHEEAQKEQVRFRLPVSGEHWGYIDERWELFHGYQSGLDDDDNLYFENVSMADLADPFRFTEYTVRHNWYVDAALKEVITDLAIARDITFDAASQLIRRGGFRIYLCVDVEMQEKLEELFDPYCHPIRKPCKDCDPLGVEVCDPYRNSRFRGRYLIRDPDHPYSAAGVEARNTLQAAFVVMNMHGDVVAVSGGVGNKPGNDAFNRASQAQRNVGSTIKPFGVYAPAVDRNRITYSTLLMDFAGRIDDPRNPGDFLQWPSNYTATAGQVRFGDKQLRTAWWALMKSTNTISARTLHMLGPNAAFNFLQNDLHISTLTSRHLDYSPLATGAMEMKLHELTAAYQIFGTGGVYYKPSFYLKVVDHSGATVLEKDHAGTQAIAADSAWIINRMMNDVVEDPNGTGRWASIPGVEVVGKTGTANDLSDLLFAGLTPDYVAVIRFGYDDNRAMSVTPGGTRGDRWRPPTRIWNNIMAYIIPEDTASKFECNHSVGRCYGICITRKQNYCPASGFLIGPRCEGTGLVGWYRATPAPRQCTHDQVAWDAIVQEEAPHYRAW
jgi:penicillin-binding protein 1A